MKEIKVLEVSSCNNCKKWKNCMERGRGVCKSYERRITPFEAKLLKKAKRKESIKHCVKGLVVVFAIFGAFLI